MQSWWRWLTFALLVLTWGVPVSAAPLNAPAGLCETAVTTAEAITRLPTRLLGAIAVVESGRQDKKAGMIRPWPWTINAEGVGQFFASRPQAIAAVKALQIKGVRSIDVGCLQVNLLYHSKAFPTLEAAFDPLTNARYAARFLTNLYAESGAWPHAISAYHSQTPVLGANYRTLVMARWEHPSLARTVLAHAVYRDFLPVANTYGAFEGASRTYAAFGRPWTGQGARPQSGQSVP